MKRLIVLAAAVVGFSGTASAGPLWQNTAAGMSVEQLRAAQPKLHEAAKEGEPNYRKGCDYTIGAVTIASFELDSCFSFRDGRLVEVGLFQPLTESAISAYSEFKTILAAKYGAPVIADECSGGGGVRSCRTVFKGEGVTITTSQLSAFGKQSGNVRYEALPEGANQL